MLIITSRKGNTMGAHRLGRTRSEIETNLQKEWGTSALTEEQIDKCKFLEKKAEIKEGFIRDSKLIDRA
jgi:hypothetical protein